jgi:diguanylate cyclase (GGDEF)-like protein
MDPNRVLAMLRPLVLQVTTGGTIDAVHGGFGGFLGHDLDALVGRDALDIVDPADHDEVLLYLAAAAPAADAKLELPLPFRTRILDATGRPFTADVIPSRLPDDAPVDGWVVTIVPLAMQASSSRSLDAELGGASRDDVKQSLAEELQIDTPEWTARVFLVDLPSREVTSGRDPLDLGDVVAEAIAAGWSPWNEIGTGLGEFGVPIGTAPVAIQSLAFDFGWTYIEAVPVVVHGEQVAAYVRLSRPHISRPIDTLRTNIAHRIGRLVGVTRLLYGRWIEQDALAATCAIDPLTGLAGPDALTVALAEPSPSVAVLYIDVDHFGAINDRWGRSIGDTVLCEVARRISAACRRDDVVARVGGDEFVVLLRCVDDVIAGRICRRIIDEVAIPLNLPGGPREVTVSIGMAADRQAGDLIAQADRAMLSAKRQGRSRLVSA